MAAAPDRSEKVERIDRMDRDRDDKERSKAVELAVGQIEKQFGKGSIMRLGGKETIAPIPAISTGSISLDWALGVGGLPRGRVIEIFGPESSGKTTLALQTIAQAQKLGGVARLDFTDIAKRAIAKHGQVFGGDFEFLFCCGSGHGSDSFYFDLTHDPLRFRPLEIDGEQPVFQLRALHLDTVGQDEGTLKLAGRDAAVEIGAGPVIDLTAPDHELVFLEGDFKLVARESGDRKGDAEFLRGVFTARHALYIVGRIAVIGRFRGPVENALEIVESEQIGAGKQRDASHDGPF